LTAEEWEKEKKAEYWRGHDAEAARLGSVLQRQRELTGMWHAKYEQVVHENNRLRKELWRRERGKTRRGDLDQGEQLGPDDESGDHAG
jgi:hypothetical protein